MAWQIRLHIRNAEIWPRPWPNRIIGSALIIINIISYLNLHFSLSLGDQFDRFLWNYDHNFCHVFYTSRPFTITVSAFVFILPLCYPKRIDFLKYASAAGVLAIVYVDVLQVWKYYSGEYKGNRGEIKTGPDRWTDVFLVGQQLHLFAIVLPN